MPDHNTTDTDTMGEYAGFPMSVIVTGMYKNWLSIGKSIEYAVQRENIERLRDMNVKWVIFLGSNPSGHRSIYLLFI